MTAKVIHADDRRFSRLPVATDSLESSPASTHLGILRASNEEQCAIYARTAMPEANIIWFLRTNGTSYGLCHLYRRDSVIVLSGRAHSLLSGDYHRWVSLQASRNVLSMFILMVDLMR